MKLFLLFFCLVQTTYGAIGFKIPADEDSHLQFGSEPLEETLPATIKVLVWNIYKGGKKDFVTDYPVLAEGKDLILLQEVVDTPELVSILSQSYPKHHYRLAASFTFQKKGRETATGVALASPTKPTTYDFRRSQKRELYFLTPKTINFAKYALEGRQEELLVLNIHGLNFVPSEFSMKQLKQVEPIIAHHKGPILFGGDFNTNTHKKMRELRGFMQKHLLQEVEFVDGHLRLKAPNGIPLDHVFVRGLLTKSAYTAHHFKGSDHKALVLEVIPTP